MRWKWLEATSKWLLGSYCDDREPVIPEHERAYCIITKRKAYRRVETAVRNDQPTQL